MNLINNDDRYYESVDKEYIQSLPERSFEGKIYLIDSFFKQEKIKPVLLQEKAFGFDTETKPSFKKGNIHQVALIQLATSDKAFLFRLNKIKMPDFLIQIIQSPQYIKIGTAIKEDLNALNRLQPFDPKGFIDLQDFVKKFGITDNGLKKLAANVLGIKISKKNQTSNWERTVLTKSQIQYAATDAWVCLEIYKTLNHADFSDNNNNQL